jgi:hypothetical protein
MPPSGGVFQSALVEFRSVHMSLDHVVDLFPRRRRLIIQSAPPRRNHDSSLASLSLKRVDVGIGASFLRPSVLYTCSPKTSSMHNADDRRFLVLTPDPTTPVIRASLETRVASNLAQTGSLRGGTSRQTEWRRGGHDEAIQWGEKKRWIHVKMIHWQYYSTVVRSRPACDKHVVGGKYVLHRDVAEFPGYR